MRLPGAMTDVFCNRSGFLHHRGSIPRQEARLERLLSNHPVREQFTAMVRRGDIALADVGEGR